MLLKYWMRKTFVHPCKRMYYRRRLADGQQYKITDSGKEEWFAPAASPGDLPWRHREDGPALIWPSGLKEWFWEGERHREDGPAITETDGRQTWYFHGQLHRKDGPAHVMDGNTEWWLHGKLHRADGPAKVLNDGQQEWWLNGQQHRLDGPAVIEPDGKQIWYKHNVHHREDGPAIIYPNGRQEWWVDGKRHREDGPALVTSQLKEWWVDGEMHREGAPAREVADGGEVWACHSQIHRIDGPAVTYGRTSGRSGEQQWWLHGKQMQQHEWLVLAAQVRGLQQIQATRRVSTDLTHQLLGQRGI